ncbi:hypothetical protein Pmar_PMAR017081 [Perkinsus marinus ATCC 50983]|uniref:Uncharacterized protein n=1 Tax=Perkinsus marinus (strain ATCC 50983 / TXsc) TaxID=423536 RepID=C5LSI2_PERM5|nr:hypothetical protein Pmar_PMAR017081 [Perkinsus marinus ATCC 50983]EER00223.1 hypothetical protein Pmar_PMAR017081 [Perkinsus marinus ATCC 50983]|eukprot:XP_002767505.1 hypothetical protein Pmar_PMAR017081 [Perkinsus marinus ATCC 50983]
MLSGRVLASSVHLQAASPSLTALQACRSLVDNLGTIVASQVDRSPSSHLQTMRQALLVSGQFKPKDAKETRSFVSDLIEVQDMLASAGMVNLMPPQSERLVKLARMDAARYYDGRKENQIVKALAGFGMPAEVVYTSPRLSHIKVAWMKGALVIPQEGCDEESLQRYARRIAETEVCKVAILDKWDTASNQRHYLKNVLVALQQAGPVKRPDKFHQSN